MIDYWDEDNYYATPDYDDAYEFRGKTKAQLEEEMKAKVLKEQEERLERARIRLEYEKMLLGYNLKKRDREYKTEYERYCARLAKAY